MHNRQGKCSVFRTDCLKVQEVWAIGEECVAKARSKLLLGKIDLVAQSAFDCELDIIPDTQIHNRHADITSYPDEPKKVRLIAIKLADISTFTSI